LDNFDVRAIVEIAKEAGAAAMRFYNDPQTTLKEDMSPVTRADLAADKALLEKLGKMGDFGILSEETYDDKARLDKEYVWIIDPIDGTADFIQKTGEFAVMVGLVKNGEPVMGVVHMPAVSRTYFAQKGKGAFVQDETGQESKIAVSKEKELSEARLVVSRNHLSEKDRAIATRISENFVQSGSNGVKMCLIAEGKAEIFFNTGTGFGEYDGCAPQIILTEAGGKVSDVFGKPLNFNKKVPKLETGIAASNGLLHDELIAKISQKK